MNGVLGGRGEGRVRAVARCTPVQCVVARVGVTPGGGAGGGGVVNKVARHLCGKRQCRHRTGMECAVVGGGWGVGVGARHIGAAGGWGQVGVWGWGSGKAVCA